MGSGRGLQLQSRAGEAERLPDRNVCPNGLSSRTKLKSVSGACNEQSILMGWYR